MATASVTSKGQITIPAGVRAALGLETGSRVEFVENRKGKVCNRCSNKFRAHPQRYVAQTVITCKHRRYELGNCQTRGQSPMIGLDTNVLVRYIAQDDAEQSPIATKLITSLTTENPGFISQVSLVELVRVMQSCYKAGKPEVVAILETLLSTRELLVENTETAIKALKIFETSKADFSDCLIERTASKAGCLHCDSFDTHAIKTAGFKPV